MKKLAWYLSLLLLPFAVHAQEMYMENGYYSHAGYSNQGYVVGSYFDEPSGYAQSSGFYAEPNGVYINNGGYVTDNCCDFSQNCCSSCFDKIDMRLVNDWIIGWDVILRTAYWYPSSNLFREIYNGARFDAEIEVIKQLCGNFYVFKNTTFFEKDGHSIGLDERTNIKLYPSSAGLMYVQPINCDLSVYAGLGPNWTWMSLWDDVPFGNQKKHKSCWGCTAKMGVYYEWDGFVFLDAFMDYLYIPMNLANVSNIGGFRFGLGIGVHLSEK